MLGVFICSILLCMHETNTYRHMGCLIRKEKWKKTFFIFPAYQIVSWKIIWCVPGGTDQITPTSKWNLTFSACSLPLWMEQNTKTPWRRKHLPVNSAQAILRVNCIFNMTELLKRLLVHRMLQMDLLSTLWLLAIPYCRITSVLTSESSNLGKRASLHFT